MKKKIYEKPAIKIEIFESEEIMASVSTIFENIKLYDIDTIDGNWKTTLY